MELSTLFTEFVLGMCVVHLVGMASERVAQWRTKNTHEQRTVSGKSAQKNVRSDWYVFFSCSDLYGKEPKPKQSKTVQPADKVRPTRDQRPTLRV
jgi:hypothetical protein